MKRIAVEAAVVAVLLTATAAAVPVNPNPAITNPASSSTGAPASVPAQAEKAIPAITPRPVERKAEAGIIALAIEGKRIPTFHPGWLSRQWMDTISYSDAEGLANARQITDILVNETSPPDVFIQTPSGSAYRFTLPSIADLHIFTTAGVRVSVMAGTTTMSVVTDAGRALLQIAFAVGILTFAAVQAKGRIKMPARRIKPEANSTTFSDVAGQEGAKGELREVIELLRNPTDIRGIGARIPKGVLMWGPPGNGKTLMARAVANEAGVPFFSVPASMILDKFIGVGSKRIREIFRQARKAAPCVLFLDEIDILCATRTSTGTDAGEDRAQILATLLVEIDGVEALGDVVLIGATNRIEVMDPAVLRAGRLERHVHVPTPTRAGRRSILELESNRLKVDPDLDMDRIERITIGFSGADLAGMMNEAALGAVRAGRKAVTMEDVVTARDRMLMGATVPGSILSDAERLMTARHEAGHAVAARHAPESDSIDRASILPRARSLGHVMRLPDRDRQMTTRSRILSDLMVAMAGRASEVAHYPAAAVTTGARGDIAVATSIARDYVMADGMDEEIGMVNLMATGATGNWSWPPPSLGDRAGSRIKAMLDQALAQAIAVIEQNRDEVSCIVGALLEAETLTGDEIEVVVASMHTGTRSVPSEDELMEILATTSPHGPTASHNPK